MKSSFTKKLITPLGLLLLCILSYGLLIPWLGLYWDDWVYTWFGHVLGPGGYATAFAHDRPFLSLIYMVTTSILGQNPVAWQLAGLFSRWGLVLLFQRFLSLVWPQEKYSQPILLASALFAIYPGFSQHSISVIYSQAYILFGFFLFSLILMVLAIRSVKYYWVFTIISVISALVCHLSTEYFFGLEFIRPFFIWLLIPGNKQPITNQIKQTFRHWSPYFLVSLAYILFRYLQTKAPGYAGYEFSFINGSSPGIIHTVLNLLQEIISTTLKAGITAWTQATRLFSFPLEAPSTWTYYGVMILAFILIVGFGLLLSGKANQGSKSEHDLWGLFAIVTGLAAIFLGRVPSWIAGLPFDLEFPYDRFMLSTTFGSSLLISGLIIYFFNSGRRRIIITALIISSAVGWNFYTSNTFRRDWQNQTEFFQQLAWRIPGLTPGTIVLTHELPLKYYSDNSLTAPLNWIYSPEFDGKTAQMPYILVYTKIRLGQSLENLLPDQPVHFSFRALDFTGSTSDTVSIYYPGNACLRVLDSEYTNQNSLPVLPEWYEDLIPLSDITRIINDPESQATLPRQIFSGSHQEDWCYYFEKAELARQNGDFKTVVNLKRTADEIGFKSETASEYLVFIEGYAHEGMIADAEQLSDDLFTSEPGLTAGLCQIWERVKENLAGSPEEKIEIERIISEMDCTVHFQDN